MPPFGLAMKDHPAPAMPAADTILGAHLDDRPRAAPVRVRRRSDALAYLLMVGMLLMAWQMSRMQLYSARSDTGYWIGVVGGTMMLLLFAYPLRKRWQVLAGLGKAKHWFVVHMVLGIFGPVLVLAHSTFQIGSVNAGVALFSMLIVAASGVAGRFIYLRIHRGLGGEMLSLEALRKALGFSSEALHTTLHFAPAAEARLRALERHLAHPSDRMLDHLRRVTLLPWQLRLERKQCWRDTKRALARQAKVRGWDGPELQRRARRARALVDDYFNAVLRVAQLAAYTRLFSLWHVLHVPFVFVMVLCAIAHVVAVHAY
jgi:hypothetical protein